MNQMYSLDNKTIKAEYSGEQDDCNKFYNK